MLLPNVNIQHLLVLKHCKRQTYIPARCVQSRNADRQDREYRKLVKRKELEATILSMTKQSFTSPEKNNKFQEYKYAEETPVGEKKDVSEEASKTFSPKFVESSWYSWWDKQGYFAPPNVPEGKRFSMVFPPPNVTGELHMGHALTLTVQDVIARWRKMHGDDVLWLPGTDHAGIATQVVVERNLALTTGDTRHTLGRQKFVDAVLKWKMHKGGQITMQLKRLGGMLDWNREAFTMNKHYTKAVNQAFIRLFDEGLIYRDKRLVNWCCDLQSTVSDLEVETIEVNESKSLKVPGSRTLVNFGVLHKFAYKLVHPVDDISEIVVATTRLETIYGDTAVAVHPNDARYSKLVGRMVKSPLIPGHHIPIIADEAVDMELGTGALKVTPAHDFIDAEIGERHGLRKTSIFTKDGLLKFPGSAGNAHVNVHLKPRFDARLHLLRRLNQNDLYRGSLPHKGILRLCSRTGDVIEPMLMDQWFVRTKDMAKSASDAVSSGEINFIQPSYINSWHNWLGNLQDWCISRQLWWGHQIPAYKCKALGKSQWVAARSESEAAEKAAPLLEVSSPREVQVEQDPDVLDTWFSSALYPFASLGWPNQTKEMERFYPLDLMETGQDLLFFWVARMTMLGIKLTGQVPFKNVLFHTMIRDGFGRKMSKSLGNVIDPIQIIDGASAQDRMRKLHSLNVDPQEVAMAVADMRRQTFRSIPPCGSDALRISLLANRTLNADMTKFDVEDAVKSRMLCNKIWNAFKLVCKIAEVDSISPERIAEVSSSHDDFDNRLTLYDRWIKSKLARLVASCDKSMTSFNPNRALDDIVHFIRSDFCDLYLETCKVSISLNDNSFLDPPTKLNAQLTCLGVFETTVRLLAPTTPFLAEEMWQRLPRNLLGATGAGESVCVAPYPRPELFSEHLDPLAEEQVASIVKLCERSRHLDKLFQGFRKGASLLILCRREDTRRLFAEHSRYVGALTSYPQPRLVAWEDRHEILPATFHLHNDDTDDVSLLFQPKDDEFMERIPAWISHLEKAKEKLHVKQRKNRTKDDEEAAATYVQQVQKFDSLITAFENLQKTTS